ncbi:MAG: SDR family oxidoreductase [Proteobacteria bacterium]|jgi:NAD(P)-dependent dehydrogenase (short-subunit alcohol dehydrogenase family)|nr:SDR family oxidoreductase [Pseudomonadota bacterium]
MAKRFENKVVWITGGGSGIGRALAVEFARHGALVAVSGRREANLLDVVKEIEAAGSRGLAVVCDVCDENSQEAAVGQVVDNFGQLDVAIANAGFGIGGRIEDVTVAEWRRQLDTNVIGLTTTIRVSMPHLQETSGRMVLVGSAVAFFAAPGNGAYCASKAAVRSIGNSLYSELAGTGVSCTTIHPGFVESEIGQVDNKGVFRAEFEDKRPSLLMWTAKNAAKAMIPPIYRRRREHTFSTHGKFVAFIGSCFPSLTYRLMALSQRRK